MGKIRALIVDDSSVMRKIVKRSLRRAGIDLAQVLEAGNGAEAPAGLHMTVRRCTSSKTTIHLSSLPENALHVPSVDVLMLSVAEVFGARAMGVIMTGMGADGALGMDSILRHRATTLGQDESTCTVYGMPRACAEMGVLRRVVPLLQIPSQILQAVGYRPRLTHHYSLST